MGRVPTYWSAEEWFRTNDPSAGLTGRESDQDLKDRVTAELAAAADYLEADDGLRYPTEKRDELPAELAEQSGGRET